MIIIMETIPVIDMSPLIKGDNERASSTIQEIMSALKELGLFYATGHGMCSDTLHRVLQNTRDFFDLPAEKRNMLSYRKNKAYRGYIYMGAETTAAQADVKEGMSFGSEFQADSNSPMCGYNVFPDDKDIPCFKASINKFMSRMNELGNVISNAFFMEFDGGEKFLKSTFNPAFYNMNLWHYPSNPGRDQYGIGEHTDYESFTFILQDDIGGLQMQKRDGSWIDVPPQEGTFVVMIGDVMECWTKGLYRAPIHRVKNTAEKSRYSVAFFYQPSLDTMVKPLEIPEILEREFKPTRSDITLPFYYGQRLHMNYQNFFPPPNI